MISNMPFEDRLRTAFSDIGIVVSDKSARLFRIYYELLSENNKNFNLTAVDDENGVITRHFADSLLPLEANMIKSGCLCADVGSGAGFPGLPLAIMCPEAQFVLMDSIGKRVAFLEKVIAAVGLTNCSAVCIRAEDAAHCPEYRERFDVVVSRAVSRLSVLCELCLPLVKVGGIASPLKSVSALDELKGAENAIRLTGGEFRRLYGTDERNIVIIEKIAQTPERFPRRAGVPEKRPL